MSGAFKWCMTSPLNINSFVVSSQLIIHLVIFGQSGAVMASCSKCLFEEEIEQAWLEKLTDSDHCSSSSDDESSGTDDLVVDEVIAMECGDEEDDIVRGSSAPSATSASRMNYESPFRVTYGHLFIQAKTLFQTAFISGDTDKTAAIVLSFVEPFLKKGYTLWVENFYNSPALAQKLKSLKTVLEPYA